MQTAEGMDVFDILPSQLFLIFLLMTDRIDLPLDPEEWPGTPENSEYMEARRRRSNARLMHILMDDLDKRNCRHA